MSPILVCGLGRCGSTMLMRMLDAGGYPVFGEAPAYEPEELMPGCDMRIMLPKLAGKAAKILDPHRATWPDSFNAKILWLDRDSKEQAKSQVKFIQQVAGFDIPGNSWRAMRAGLRSDRMKCMVEIFDMEKQGLFLHFEDILDQPYVQAKRIAEFITPTPISLGMISSMAGVVMLRTPGCRPDMSIEMSQLHG